MLTVGRLAVSVAAVMLLAVSSYAWGAPASEGFALSAIQINPKNPNIVYASSLLSDADKRSVVKSTDGGQTWKAADTGLTEPASPADSEDLRVDALALDPRSPNVLYAGTGNGVYKTSDGARTWKRASTGIDFGGDPVGHRMLEGFIWAIAIDPLQRSTVYAASLAGVWRTKNGGATWKRVLQDGVVNLGIDPRQPKTVYASGMEGYGKTAPRSSILKTVDGGDTWRATGPSSLHDRYFGHPIAIDHRAPGTIYAGGSRGLFASANRGRTWAKLLSGSEAERIDAIALDPTRASILYVGGWARGVVKSDDGGQTWMKVRLDMRKVGSIAIAPTRPQTIYAGGGDGLAKSTDGGATWQRLPLPPYR